MEARKLIIPCINVDQNGQEMVEVIPTLMKKNVFMYYD